MTTKKKIKTIFMGTPEFAVPALEALVRSDFIDVIAVVANPDRPVGRKQTIAPPPTKLLAEKYGIPVLQPDRIKKPEWIEKIKELNPELIIVAAFGQIIPKEILNIPKYKTLNIHGSLLPQLRGPSPIPYAILEGHQKTGNTIMLVDEQMDHGAILLQRELQISEKETAETLFEKMAKMGADLLMEILPLWIDGKLTPQEQNHSEATYCKIITRDDGKIDWSDTADNIERKIRAFTSWPGTFCFFQDQNGDQKRLKIIEANIIECGISSLREIEARLQPDRTVVLAGNAFGQAISIGLLFENNHTISVQTGKGCLRLIKVQPEGKSQLSTEEFLNGYKYLLGKKIF